MAYDDPGVDIGTFTASADLSAKQFYIVKMSGDNTVTVCAAVTAVFDACQIAFAEAGVTKELGTDAPGDGDAFSTIESLAKGLVSEGKATNFHTAVAQVAQDRPELYAAYVGEKG